MRYVIYARKSQEADDKQVLSLDSQINALEEIANKENLNIIKIFKEAKSAKYPGRLLFNEMIAMISKNEADGILVWHPDRLSRNPLDAGVIIHLIDQGLLKEIRTPSQIFRNTPTEKFLLNLLLSNAKLDNDNKSENVKRGLVKRANLGLYPYSSIPVGYINVRDEQTNLPKTIKDPERFHLVRKMWDLMLTGNYTVPQILKIANEEWSFRTRKKRKSGGKPLSRSGLYNIFTNPFYYGWYKFNNEWRQSNHPPMITKEEFDRVQIILGRKGFKGLTKHQSTYRGIFKCGECGLTFTMTEKIKFYKKTKNLRKYLYYHCTKKNRVCHQKPITEEELESQILDILGKIEMDNDFKEWAFKYLRFLNEKEKEEKELIVKNLQNNYNEIQKKIDRLVDAYISGLIENEKEFKLKKEELLKEKEIIKNRLENIDYRSNKWVEECENVIDFSTNLKERFKNATPQEKRLILTQIGSNFIIKDRKVFIELNKPYFIFKETKEKVKENLEILEPVKKIDIPSELLAPLKENPVWLPRLDSNQQPRS